MKMTTRFPSLLVLILAASWSVVADARLVGEAQASKAQQDQRDLLMLSTSNKTACELIRPEELPDECTCREPGPFSLVLECLKEFNHPYFNDTIGMKIDVNPCNPMGSSMSIDVKELNHNIEYPITGIRAGEEKNIPIPGLSIMVPTLGHLGVDVAVLIFGNPDELSLKVGLNACLGFHDHTLCASSIPGLHTILPWYVLSGTYSFGSFCNSTEPTSLA